MPKAGIICRKRFVTFRYVAALSGLKTLIMMDSTEFLRTCRRRVLQVTLEDLKRVAETYLKPENAGIAVLTDPASAAKHAGALGLEIIDL